MSNVDEKVVALLTAQELLAEKVKQQENDLERLEAQRRVRLLGVHEPDTGARPNT